ncbi:MAG: hypothetical protein MZV63_66680 [Marinilabiliales bacterium]|nr:hypothetical protein [Marinilabiliales bacterium]
MLWGLPAFLSQSAGAILEKFGASGVSRLLGKIPEGFKTDFQDEIEWLIQTELLELPCSDGVESIDEGCPLGGYSR